MMMQESPGAGGIGNFGSSGRFKEQQQRSKISPSAEDQALKCPRCDSPNTKFCYYNNYNLTQPRHFCKTCRRYWTKGGALRNVPIGGGCRKNKRPKQRSSASSRDQIPLMIALENHHRHSNPNPNPHHHPHPQNQNQNQNQGEESSSPLLQNAWGAPNSNYHHHHLHHLDLASAESLGMALAKLQNRPSLLAMQNPMATLVYDNPSAILPSGSSNFGYGAGPEPNFGSVAEDIMQWRIQQQSRLAALQQHLNGDPNNNINNNQSHDRANANDSNIDLMLISSPNVDESKPADHQQQQKGKSIISNDLQAEWPGVADCLFEPHAVAPGESTSGYWYGLQQLAEN